MQKLGLDSGNLLNVCVGFFKCPEIEFLLFELAWRVLIDYFACLIIKE
jgi:hypothetical protein